MFEIPSIKNNRYDQQPYIQLSVPCLRTSVVGERYRNPPTIFKKDHSHFSILLHHQGVAPSTWSMNSTRRRTPLKYPQRRKYYKPRQEFEQAQREALALSWASGGCERTMLLYFWHDMQGAIYVLQVSVRAQLWLAYIASWIGGPKHVRAGCTLQLLLEQRRVDPRRTHRWQGTVEGGGGRGRGGGHVRANPLPELAYWNFAGWQSMDGDSFIRPHLQSLQMLAR